jgi:glycosyltransferase involved in cell wall biosynthesis
MKNPEISIVVCTLDRPGQLELALLSCLGLLDLDAYCVELLIVDNSPLSTARDLANRLAACARVPIRYFHEPRQGIAHARNAGIAAAAAPLIAFLDDDMLLSPNWLGSVMRGMAENQADALICAITPSLEDTRQIVDARTLAIYRRDLGLDEGSRVPIKASGHIPMAGAGNSVLRRASCFSVAEPFDPAFGNGGEDTDFFLRLGRRASNIRWSVDSMAYEMVSPNRAKLEFVAYSTFHGSRNLARALIKNSRHRLASKAALLMIGVTQGVWRLTRYYLLRTLGSAEAPYARLGAMAGFGKIPWRLDKGAWWALPR